MLVFGVLGYLMKTNDFPVMPTVLGIILGPIADRELLRTVQMYSGNYLAAFQKPIVLVLLFISITSVVVPMILKHRDTKNGM